jgi:choline dehydrogenase-like flavoprotein
VERLGFYDVHRTPAGALRGRLAVREETMRRKRTLNFSATLRRRPAWMPRVEIELNLEQAPDFENRVTLGRDRDAFGLPRPEIHWHWREIDRASHAHLRALLGNEFESRGIGRLEVRSYPGLDAAACHPTGTTRMSANPELGVVDADARVHGVSNLFVAGSSVFPTGGFANPTLTIVALSLRLAEHLSRRLLREPVASPAVESPLVPIA